MKTFSTF